MRFLSKKNIGDGVEVLHTTPGASFTLTAVDDNGRPTGCCNPDIVKASHELVNEILPKDGTIDGVKDVIVSLSYMLAKKDDKIDELARENSSLKGKIIQLNSSNTQLIRDYNWNSEQRIKLKNQFNELHNEYDKLKDIEDDFTEEARCRRKLENKLEELKKTVNEQPSKNGRVFNYIYEKEWFKHGLDDCIIEKVLDALIELVNYSDNGKALVNKKIDIAAIYLVFTDCKFAGRNLKPVDFSNLWNINIMPRINNDPGGESLYLRSGQLGQIYKKEPFSKAPTYQWRDIIESMQKIKCKDTLKNAFDIKKYLDNKFNNIK